MAKYDNIDVNGKDAFEQTPSYDSIMKQKAKDTKKALSAHVDDEDKRIIKRGDLPPLDLTIEGKLKVDILPMIPNRGLTFINV